ncbi:MAG: DNA polymerase III subunit beta, partial [Clostridiales bacterium]|nr:DNA polymerase III subunit beta [Clostridiales bacterium]
MKIICSKNQLLHGINIVSKAVSNKSTMEILQCILIEANDNIIKLTANDTELGIETIIEGDIIVSGKIALEARLFSEIIKKVPENDVIIESNSNVNTSITCEQMECNIMGKEGDDFTHLPKVEKNNKISISQFDLKEIIRQTIFSISDNENNKIMTGELLNINGNKFKMTSLDGHRISIRNTILSDDYPEIEVIIPGKTLTEVSKILPGEAEDVVNLYITDKHVLFEFENTRVVSRLLEGKFYNIRQMLSTDYETKVTVNKMEFLRCLDRSTLFIKESDKKPVVLKISDNKMELMINTQVGSMDDKIQIEKEGKDLLIGFNPRFLADALRVIDEEDIVMYMINSIGPCI